MICVLALSLFALFCALLIMEVREHETPLETAASSHTLDRLQSLFPALEGVQRTQLPRLVSLASSCHAGYTVTEAPFRFDGATAASERLRLQLARALRVDAAKLKVGLARLGADDFSYRECRRSEIQLPVDAVVFSYELPSGAWLNTEVHAHEWHWREKLDWMVRATAAFIFVGAVAMYFMRRLHKPLRRLTDAAQQFGQGLEVHQLAEDGPADVKSAIRAFNAMQQQVAEEVTKRANTLAAISHDVRTPLTALRVKAELIEDEAVRRDLISSVDRMEQVTASALDFLRGQSRGEPLRSVDLSALLESACLDLAEIGQPASFAGEHGVHHVCRPDAIARAVRNLIDNAIKYGGGARVTLQARAERVEIAVADNGPGIPFDQIALALEPFQRLPEARRSQQSGFGLGLTVAKAITEGHEGELVFAANTPTGLVATIRLPAKQI